MNIQRFKAANMRNAMFDVRRRLGPDAFILHSKAVDGGVEVVAAVDYDPGLFDALDRDAAAADSAPGAASDAAPSSPGAGALHAVLDDADEAGHAGDSPTLYDRFAAMGAAAAEGARPAPTSPAGGAADRAPGPGRASRGAFAVNGRDRQLRASERLDDVGAELRSLRTLVEQQLSGLAWQDLMRRHPERAAVLRRLLAFGLTPLLAREVVDALPSGSGPLWPLARAELGRRLPRGGDDILSEGGVVALVGATGVGKTTTIAKLAGAYTLRHGPGSVGLVTTDDFRLGAHEQLQAFGRILDIPVCHARDSAAVRDAVHGFGQRTLVLIDTEGVGDHAQRQGALLSALDGTPQAPRVFLLLAANAQRASLLRSVRAFERQRLHGCIVTKLDECGSLGEVLSAIITAGLPLAYVSDGQQVPDDLHAMQVEELLRRGEALIAATDEDLEDEVMGLTFGKLMAGAHG